MKSFHAVAKTSRQSGQVAKLLLILAVIVVFAMIITFVVIKGLQKPTAPVAKTDNGPPQPVYEQQLGNIKFSFESAIDMGNTLKVADAVNKQSYAQSDVTTTERYIEVTVGAQNEGTQNTDQSGWDIENIIDSAGRNFEPLDNYVAAPWLPTDNNCGSILEPAFDPLPCTKIYAVAKASTGLKIQVATGQTNNSANDFSAGHRLTYNLDMIVK